MLELTAEQFAQRSYELNLLDQRQLDSVWSQLGTQQVSVDEFQNALVRRELLTNYQVERLLSGETAGFFYGDFKVLYLVGTGSFARVYRAVNVKDGKVYAVKVLRKRYNDSPGETAKFLREGKMGQALRHPNVVPIYEVHSIRRTHFLVLEFVEGQSLRQFLKIRQKLSADETCEIMSGILSGLAHAFEKGITHRDLKLSNVLISSEGVPMLVDFGLAGMEGEHSNARTVDYAALEKLTNVSKGDVRSDLYFCGCMMYHLLTGENPLKNTKELSRFRQVRPVRELEPMLPLNVEMVVNKAMELDINRRYQTPVEMLVDLHKARRALDPEVGHETNVLPVTAETRRVLVIESNDALQDALRTGLKRSGFRALVIGDPQRALQRLSQDPDTAQALIVSFASLGREALRLHQQLLADEKTAKLPQLLLFGKSQAAFSQKLNLPEHCKVLAMPLKMSDVRESLSAVLPKQPV